MNAPAQGSLFGYATQFPRALYRLLTCPAGSIVSVEHLADVATELPSGEVQVEEDKCSTNGNPVTDRSVDLWKSFSNWVDDVLNGSLEIDKTLFVLFRNRSGRKGIVESFDEAESLDAAKAAIAAAKKELATLDDTHDAWRFYNNAAIDHAEVLEQIIVKFTLETGSRDGYEELREALLEKWVPENRVNDVVHILSGWLVETVAGMISRKEKPRIKHSDFREFAKKQVNVVRARELLDFAFMTPPRPDQIQNEVNSDQVYVKQLALIEVEDYELVESVTDYLSAKLNRQNWIEEGVVDERDAANFESKLIRFWKSREGSIQRRLVHLSDVDKGRELLGDCLTRQETFGETHPPATTISGTYHELANRKSVGWHPNWETLLE